MRPLEAYESLMSFAAERGEEALHLALHASVPQSFRPDFLHLLRLNFLPDLSAAAEADVLLAPFCEDTGGGYYQFDSEVRRLLLSHLDPTFPEEKGERLHRVANLLVSYIRYQGQSLSAEQDRLSEEYLSIQSWVALAFLDTQQAAMQLAAALEQGLDERETVARVQFSGLSAALSMPLVQYPKLLTYAAGLEALEQGRTEDAADLLARLPDEEIRIGDVTLRSPRWVIKDRPAEAFLPESPTIPPEIRYRSCFISYPSQDMGFLERLRQSLQNHGVPVWNAPHDVPSGVDFSWAVHEAIGRQDILLAVLSKNSPTSQGEIAETAFARSLNKPIIGLRIESSGSASNPLLDFILQKEVINFTDWRDPKSYDLALGPLLDSLRDKERLPSPRLKADAPWKSLEQAGFRYHCYIAGADPKDGKPFSFTEMLVDELTNALRAHFANPQVFFDKSLQPQIEYSASLHDVLCRSAVMVVICSPRYLEPKGRSGREWAAMETLQRQRIPDGSLRSIVPVILRRSKVLPRAVQEAHPLDLSKIDLGHKSQLPAIARSAAGEIAETILRAVESLSRRGARVDEPTRFSLPRRSAFDDQTKPGNHSVYLCYSRLDLPMVSPILKAFQKAGISVQPDIALTSAPDIFQDDVEKQISESSLFIPLLSPSFLSRSWANRELQMALALFPRLRILPVVIADFPLSELGSLSDFQQFDFRDGRDLNALVELVLQRIREASSEAS